MHCNDYLFMMVTHFLGEILRLNEDFFNQKYPACESVQFGEKRNLSISHIKSHQNVK